MNIKDALAKLDPADDGHWTADGMPRMDVLQKLTKSPDLSRTEVTNAAPDFSRASVLEAEAPAPSPEDENVEASPEAPEAPEVAEASPEVTDEKTSFADLDIPAGAVMVEAVKPGGEAVEANLAETVAVTPEALEIVTQAPEKPVSAPQTKLEALQAALAVHTDAMNAADGIKKDAVKAFLEASDQVNALNRQIEVIEKTDPHAATAGIRDYIAMQNKIRVDRAGRARAFLGNSGAKVGDIAKALEIRSPLDKAHLGRKAPRGTQRPATRIPQG